jgi:hypothetical protein
VEQLFDESTESLQATYQGKLTQLETHSSLISDLLDQCEFHLSGDCCQSSSTVQQFSEEVQGKIAGLETELGLDDQAPSAVSVPNDLVPNFETFVVEIPAFDRRIRDCQSGAESAFVYSDEKTLFGFLWRVKLYPNGNGVKSRGHLSIFVELLKGPKTPVDFCYRFALINARDPGRSITRDSCSPYKMLDSWGWNTVISVSELVSRNTFLHGEDHSLLLEISLRPVHKSFFHWWESKFKRISEKSSALARRATDHHNHPAGD